MSETNELMVRIVRSLTVSTMYVLKLSVAIVLECLSN